MRCKSCSESSANTNQHTRTNFDHCTKTSGGVSCDDGDITVDRSSDGEFYGAHLQRFSQVCGIEVA